MDSYEVGTLKKGLLIIDLLREKRALTMLQIMEELSLNKTTAYKMLYTLEKMKYIHKIDRYYYINSRVFMNTQIYSHNDTPWTSLITPYLLAKHTGETVYVGILDQYELIIKNIINVPFSKPYSGVLSKRTSIHSTAMGKAILAHLPLQQQAERLSYLSLDNITENTFNDKDLFYYHLRMIRAQGYAVDNEETNIGKRCIAAPIYFEDEVIGSLAIHGGANRIKKKAIRSLANKVIRHSKQLSKELAKLKDTD
ncbi:IclR family transcriptional regulator [Paenibacillus kribbensis]|uniref:IclR family transcriptional regulator n=1 Tax=Paenibacillus kribbensis TaxID=172713 RepID=UPI002DBDBD8A|nr:IclR family transcriptional regulator [Paenibacillus kribbensis]MEC0236243.1 IclR family transcriptional regulator [Paenibacillus kribbensis]